MLTESLITAIGASAVGSGELALISYGLKKILKGDAVKDTMEKVMDETLNQVITENPEYDIAVEQTRELLRKEIELQGFNEDSFIKILREEKDTGGFTDEFLLDFYYELLKKFEDVFKQEAVANEYAHRLWAVLNDERKLKRYQPDYREVRRIKEVYVKPKMYGKAEEILKKEKFLIITGPANVGKTSMAYYLSSKAKEEFGALRILKIERERISEFKKIKDHVILFDDVFGKAEAEKRYADEFEDIRKLKENNFVILTTRKSILDEVKNQRTRFGEISESEINNYILEVEQEGSYSDDDLSQILENHIDYYLRAGKIGETEKELALKNKNKIISGLRFPHNYELLVREQLKKVSGNEIDIEKAIDNAKHIKREAKNWFLNLDLNKKYFVFTVALFPGFEEGTFEWIYLKIVKALQKRHKELVDEDLEILRKETSSYITQSGWVNFKHPSYWEGMMEGLKYKHKEDLITIFPVLKELLKDENVGVRYAAYYTYINMIFIYKTDKILPFLKEIAEDEYVGAQWVAYQCVKIICKHKPDEILPFLGEIAEDENSLARQFAACSLGELCKVKPDEIFPILKKLTKDKYSSVRCNAIWSLGELCKVKPDEVFPILKEFAKDRDSDVRFAVASSLGHIHRLKKNKVLPVLKKLSNDEKKMVRQAAKMSMCFVEEFEYLNSPNKNSKNETKNQQLKWKSKFS